ncbi:unnamed protein product [Coffea canephora]|uniref:DH200=94 genomic scaffold, scaffold_1194 n=1 Tax=Coffea canephora TaxID=49390 RepID=A0A068VIL8_COFCA|nr:unnamed protein product [Coffea canephora]
MLWFVFLAGKIDLGLHARAHSSVSCLESEWKALLEFKKSLIDKSNRLASWTGEDCCSWEGVGCDRNTGHVVKLDLRNNVVFDRDRLISPSLVNLQHLHYLDLSSNYFVGIRIPAFIGSLKNLRYLNFSSAGFNGTIPPQLGNLSALDCLDLGKKSGGNEFDSTIPLWLFNLTSLVHLDLSSNNFFGPIVPNSLQHWSSLSYLDLSGNQFSTSLLDPLFTLNNLVHLDLSGNQIQGPLPFGLGNLTSLSVLHMGDNSFEGPIPSAIGQLRELTELDLSSNGFNGTIPSSLWRLSELQSLDLSDNPLSGELRNSGHKYRALFFLESNKFEGPLQLLPTDISVLYLKNNSLQGIIPQPDINKTLDILRMLDLSDNHFNGSIPDSLCSLQMLVVLDLSNNQLSGRIPSCIGKLKTLKVLHLANNSLYGHIPISLGHLNDLQSLHLDRNNFTGMVPFSLRYLKNLQYLDLGNNGLEGLIPSWIGDELSSLRILVLESNNFHGDISVSLCKLSSLQVLSLEDNNLTGHIPRCFNNFTAMIVTELDSTRINVTDSSGYIDVYYSEELPVFIKGRMLNYTSSIVRYVRFMGLSGNKLSGEIPVELMYLVGLHGLDLSRNHLSGRIPENIGHLSQLESLDLSKNDLSGPIPQSLSNLNSLAWLKLSFNKLTGRIPSGRQLQTLYDHDPTIYMGNSGLWGDPLDKSCPDGKSNAGESDGDHEDGKESYFDWFYAGLGPGFAVGLVGFLSVLCFKKSWRYAYFGFLESLLNKARVEIALLKRKFV